MRIVANFLLLLVFLALIVGSFGFLYWESGRPQRQVDTVGPRRATIVRRIVANGAIVPRKEVIIKPQVSGIIEEIFVQPGQEVEVGDLLARIRLVPDPREVNAARSQLAEAKLRLAFAKKELERNRKLVESTSIAESEFAKLQLDFDVAQSELKQAEEDLKLILAGEASDVTQKSNRVIATIGGMVLDNPVKQGDFVTETNTFTPGTTIVTLADMSEMLFEGYVDESDVGKIKPGARLEVNIGALDNRSFSARLETIAPKGVEREGTTKFQITAGIDLGKDILVRAGFSATAGILLEKKEDVLAIAEKHLHIEDGQAYVYVEVAPQQFEPREVTTGISDGLQIEILSGLSESDRIMAGNTQ